MVESSRGYQATMLSTTIIPSVKASVDNKQRRRGGERRSEAQAATSTARARSEPVLGNSDGHDQCWWNRSAMSYWAS